MFEPGSGRAVPSRHDCGRAGAWPMRGCACGGSTPRSVYQLLADEPFRSRALGPDRFLLGRRASPCPRSSGQQLPDGRGGDAVEGAGPAGRTSIAYAASCLTPNVPREYEDEIRASVDVNRCRDSMWFIWGRHRWTHGVVVPWQSGARGAAPVCVANWVENLRRPSHHVDAAGPERGSCRRLHRERCGEGAHRPEVLRASGSPRDLPANRSTR